jgi:hypothetical protein
MIPVPVSVSVDDYLHYVDDALDGMAAIVTELGDDLANVRLAVPGSNTPYAVLNHCLGVIASWGGYMVAGRVVDRDRDAELVSSGPVAALVERIPAVRAQLVEDLASLDPSAPLRGTPAPDDASLPLGRTQGGALIHLYEELAQHRGQVEVTRDVLLAAWSVVAGNPPAPVDPAGSAG